MSSKPKLIVFDLDYTLWPFWVDTHVSPPFRKTTKNEIVDGCGQKIRYYPEVPGLLSMLHSEGYKVGIASRTSEIKGAHQLLELFDWNKYIHYKEIYPGCKVAHFNKSASGIEYKDMMFFDDEHRNIVDINKLGVTSILVKNGMTKDILEYGLEAHKRSDPKLGKI